MGSEMETAYQGTRHTTPKTVSELPWKVYNELKDTGILTETPNRQLEDDWITVPSIDLHSKGHSPLTNSSLQTFNEKMALYREGDVSEPDEDELELMDFAPIGEGDQC